MFLTHRRMSTVVAVEALPRFDRHRSDPRVWFSEAHQTGLGPELEMLAVTRGARVLGGPARWSGRDYQYRNADDSLVGVPRAVSGTDETTGWWSKSPSMPSWKTTPTSPKRSCVYGKW